MKRILALLLLTIIAFAGCGGGGGGSISNTALLTSISIFPKDNVIAAGTTRQFTATGTFSDNSTRDLTTIVAWKSSNTSVATINPTSGMVTTGAAGTSTITATYGIITGTTTLTVPANPLVSITVTPATPSIAPGTSRQFTATGTYQNGATQDLTASATWSSSSPGVATINSAGKATAGSAGTTTITATVGATPGSTTLTVATLDSISITPPNPTLTTGTSQQFTATGTLSNASTQDLTAFVAWSSSDPSVATIDPASGKATAVSATGGTTTITATLGVISDTALLTVPIPPQRLLP